jgi:hypothetical protein
MRIRAFIEEYFWIDDAETAKLVPFRFRKPQEKYYALLAEEYLESTNFRGLREIILKARKEGFTSLVLAIFCALLLISKDPIRFLEISYKDDATKQHFRRAKVYILSYYAKKFGINPADVVKSDVEKYLEKIVFKSINEGSEMVLALNGASFYVGTASTRTGERGGTVQGVLFTEAAFYPNTGILRADEIIESTKNQIHVGTGMVFLETTANGANFFQGLWNKAVAGVVDYRPRFFSWRDFYTDEEFEIIRRSFADDAMLRQEYPDTPDEAFILSGSPFFNKQTLLAMQTIAGGSKPIYKGDLLTSKTL